jgi:ribosomal protein S18 acetylase RimI-like enzyme
VNVRPASIEDLPDLLRLYAELQPDDPPLPMERATEVWAAMAAQAGRTVLVADVDGTLVGTVDCVLVPNLTRGGRSHLLVENVVVAAAARRQRIGARLMDAAIGLATEAGCYKVQLLSRMERADAHAFYESYGFQRRAQGYRLYLP